MVRTIPNLLARAVDEVGDAPWLFFEDDVFTYGQAARRIATAVAGLADLGVGRGDLVLVAMRNTPGHLFTWLGLMRLGAVLVAGNPAATEAEQAGLVAQTEPRLGLGDADVEHLLAAGDTHPPDVPDPRPGDPAVLIPTSGTTGRSKLVTQTQHAYVLAGEGFPWWMELTADDRLMTSLPLFHINAPAYSVLGSVAARAGLVLLPRFSPGTFLDSARRYGATEFNAIGAMIEMIMARPERPDDADTPLRLAYTGPSPPEARQLEIERRLGLRLVCGYALSESPYGTIWPRGTTGDLVTENPDGTYTFIGREKEVIRRRGENLAPAEVEEALAAHTDVVEVAVVGVPSELTEEDVKAFVVPAAGAAPDPADLHAWAAERLTRYKVPRYIELVAEMPHTPTGRVAKHQLPRDRTPGEGDKERASDG